MILIQTKHLQQNKTNFSLVAMLLNRMEDTNIFILIQKMFCFWMAAVYNDLSLITQESNTWARQNAKSHSHHDKSAPPEAKSFCLALLGDEAKAYTRHFLPEYALLPAEFDLVMTNSQISMIDLTIGINIAIGI